MRNSVVGLAILLMCNAGPCSGDSQLSSTILSAKGQFTPSEVHKLSKLIAPDQKLEDSVYRQIDDCLSHRDAFVRSTACSLLIRCGIREKQQVNLLIKACQDGDLTVSWHATEALAILAPKRAESVAYLLDFMNRAKSILQNLLDLHW